MARPDTSKTRPKSIIFRNKAIDRAVTEAASKAFGADTSPIQGARSWPELFTNYFVVPCLM
eukprot:51621-Eustigmatos_ZCMA.PRE.1